MTADDEADLNLSLMPKLGWVGDRFCDLSYVDCSYLVDRGNFELVMVQKRLNTLCILQ